ASVAIKAAATAATERKFNFRHVTISTSLEADRRSAGARTSCDWYDVLEEVLLPGLNFHGDSMEAN
ncbi:MAG: hypothetical protein WBC86_20030, partial [Pseudolabrys sp.]